MFFDITNTNSFGNLTSNWINLLSNYRPILLDNRIHHISSYQKSSRTLLLGNKSDLNQQVALDDIMDLSKKIECPYMEVSGGESRRRNRCFAHG